MHTPVDDVAFRLIGDGDTVERLPAPQEGQEREDESLTRGSKCGDIILVFEPRGLLKGAIFRKRENGTTETRTRYALDNLIVYYPPHNTKCPACCFMQFVKRTGAHADTGKAAEEYSQDWQPDKEGCTKDSKFTDPLELCYNENLVYKEHGGLIRKDGPGYSYLPDHPPKDLKLHWDYKTYIVCKDKSGALKIAGARRAVHAIS